MNTVQYDKKKRVEGTSIPTNSDQGFPRHGISLAEKKSTWMQSGISQGWIRSYERSLIAFMEREFGELTEDLVQAVCILSLMENEGHSLLPLSLNPAQMAGHLRLEGDEAVILAQTRINRDQLRHSDLVLNLDGEDAESCKESQTSKLPMKPLVLKNDKLSFRRFYKYEREIERWFDEHDSFNPPADRKRILEKLNELFPEENEHGGSSEVNWKKVALILSLYKPCMIISGGPGTGKTTTIASMIRLHQELTPESLRIALAAPTGKAAGRMSESLRSVYQERGWKDNYIDELMSAEAFTLHRLLQKQQKYGLQLDHQTTYLPYDLVIVDEASMIDLNLMYRLISQTGPKTRLILLGDKEQLVSVEAGSVFSDLCMKERNEFTEPILKILQDFGISGVRAKEVPAKEVPAKEASVIDAPANEAPATEGPATEGPAKGMKAQGKLTSDPSIRTPDDSIVYLTKSYRFDEHSGIGSLATAIKKGEKKMSNIQKIIGKEPNLAHEPFHYNKNDIQFFMKRFRERIQSMRKLRNPHVMIEEWKNEIWLTVLRRGKNGSDLLSRMMEESYLSHQQFRRKAGWYHGRYVIITRNDYALGVYNGDTGVCVENEDGTFTVYIESGSDLKSFHPDRLKEYKPACFLTVHKSQGSEFHHVRLLLPIEDTPVLTKELVYTAVTRSREKFTLHGDLALFTSSIQKPAVRFTGLFQ